MSDPAEHYVDAGLALVQLGRWLQRHHPKPERAGSQYDEDKILERLLPGDEGLYVDIGASHAIECSNTWKFYQRGGWRGLLVEPLPDCWADLLLQRPQDRLCPVAASNADGYATLRVCRSVSSLSTDWNIDAPETIPVRTMPLRDILALYQGYDWSKTRLCSIDVEGHEREVLEGFDWETFVPNVIVIEYRDYNPVDKGNDVSARWRWILEVRYNLHHQNELNQIWVRK